MKIEYEIDKVFFECKFNASFSNDNDSRIFSCAMKIKFVDADMHEIVLWSGNLNFVEMQKVWILGSNKLNAFLMMKDDSQQISSLASIMVKKFTDEWPEISLCGTPMFHDYVASRNLLIDFTVKRMQEFKDTDSLKTDVSETDSSRK